jgi:hypothetical protein
MPVADRLGTQISLARLNAPTRNLSLDHFIRPLEHAVRNCQTNLFYQLGGKLREAIEPPLAISVLNGDVLPFYVAKLRKASRMASERLDSLAGSRGDRYPIRGTFFGCCA